MIWIVKGMAPTGGAGQLQQLYAADRSVAPGHPPPLVGETNSAIVLRELADTPVLTDRQARPNLDGVVLLVSLKLLSSPA
jgi:hypothetical protein